MYKLATSLCLLCFPAWACTSTTSTINTMAIISPCVDTIVSQNQIPPHVTNVAVSDANMHLTPSTHFPIQVQAPGAVNVEVRVHGRLATRLISDGVGGFSGTINIANEYDQPMLMEIDAWNSAPGTNFTVHLEATFDVRPHTNLWPPTVDPKGIVGMHQIFWDPFHKLSATPCKPGTGVWPNCAKPTAADGFTYYENKPSLDDFGNAANEHNDGKYNPFTIDYGFLRIRSTHDTAYVDPYGFNRVWRSGFLASAFPDGTSRIPPMQNGGYCEVKLKVPKADASWNTGASGGTWPAFWTLDLDAIVNRNIGNFEWDITEMYGVDSRKWHANIHSYPSVTGPNQAMFDGAPLPGTDPEQDLSWEFHRYGILWNASGTTAYFDDMPYGSTLPLSKFANGKPLNPYLLLDLQHGGGWPSNPPPAGYNDLWVKYIKCYAP